MIDWIPVADRLPDDEHPVLIAIFVQATAQCSTDVGQYFKNGQVWRCGGEWLNPAELLVTHWMELPSPPALTHGKGTT